MTAAAAARHRPTGRVLAAGLAVVALGNVALVSGSAWFVLLAGAVAGLLAAGLLGRARLDGLQVELAHQPRVTVGDLLPVRITVTNTGPRTSSECQVCLHTSGLADVVVAVGRLDPGESTRLTVDRLATRRAVADGATGHVVARPSLGFVAAQRDLGLADHLVVHPALHEVGELPPTPGTGDEVEGRVVAGAGLEVLGVREWRAGEDRGRVHWRSTARTGRPTMLERGTVESHELRVVLVGSDDHAGFEQAVALAASVCDAALGDGSRVSAVAWHRSGPVLAAAAARWELLDWWSAVCDTVLPDPGHFGRQVLAGFGPGGVLVVTPPDVDPSWLSAAAAHCPGVVLRPAASVVR